MDLTSIVTYFIHERLARDPDTLRRARYLVIYAIVSPGFFVPNVVKWYRIGSPLLAVSMFLVMVVVLAMPFILKQWGDLAVSGNLVFAALAWHFVLLPCLTGGFDSSALTWNLVVPVFAATFVGVKSCVFWTLFMVGEIFALYFMKVNEMGFQGLALTEAQLLQTQIANLLGPLFAMAITMFMVEKGIKKTLLAQQNALAGQTRAMADLGETKGRLETMTRHLERVFQKVKTGTEALQNQSLRRISEAIDRNSDLAAQSGRMMSLSRNTLSKTESALDDLSTSMAAIREASRETAEIVKNINGIAFQTHLLALNAAIEAARAGESGAGFSVVAYEVKRLAEQASAAADRTESLIADTLKKIAEGANITVRTGNAFSEMSVAMRQTMELVETIASGSAEQSATIERMRAEIALIAKAMARPVEGGAGRTDRNRETLQIEKERG